MSNFVTSLIRTYVPIIVGAIISFLTAKGIEIDESSIAGLTAFMTALFSGVYYLVVRLLEKKYPQVGILLGRVKTPDYK